MNAILRSFKERRDNDEGFTLIELMVVVLIIGILLAIAVPTFLNAQNNAKTKAATSNLRTSLSAVKTVYADKQTYDVLEADLTAAEPSLNWETASTAPEEIAFDNTATVMSLATRSTLGTCYYIFDDISGGASSGTMYGKSVATSDSCAPQAVASAPTVTADPAPAGTTIVWAKDTKGAGW